MVFTDKEGFKTVDYSRLTPVLVEAIKEQQKIINQLKADAAKNETRMNNLESRMKKLELQSTYKSVK